MRSRWVFRAERILSATVKKELNHRVSVWPARHERQRFVLDWIMAKYKHKDDINGAA
jgi:hypothetical protein